MAKLVKETIKPKKTKAVPLELREGTKKVLIAVKSKSEDIELSLSWSVKGEVITSEDIDFEEMPVEAKAITDRMTLNIHNENATEEADIVASIKQIE